MCRLYGFRSSVFSGVHQSLVAAENALVQQSRKHSDGWGLAYYIQRFPHLIRNDRQALGDNLFADLSAVVSTRTFLAHIRRATVGDVGVLNCHPFQHGAWCFAHNGEIAGFRDPELQREVRAQIDQRFRAYVLGTTDSELIFYLFLSQLARITDVQHMSVSLGETLTAMSATVSLICRIAPDRVAEEGGIGCLTFLLTNGHLMVGLRWKKELFFSTYKSFCPEREACPVYNKLLCEAPVTTGPVNHLIIASEVFQSNPNIWQELGEGCYVSVDHAMKFTRGELAIQ
jgi:glutamine amidotransferase